MYEGPASGRSTSIDHYLGLKVMPAFPGKGSRCRRSQVRMRDGLHANETVEGEGAQGARRRGTQGRVRKGHAACSRHIKELVLSALSMGLCLPC